MSARTTLLGTNLAVGYRMRHGAERVILGSLNISAAERELVCLIGANGSGKSTLLRSLAAMQPLLGGSVAIAGRDIATLRPAERARLVSVVLTEAADAGYLDVFTLVSLGRHPYTGWSGTPSPGDLTAIDDAMQRVGISELATRSVAELSDGERQKVMIARALAQETPLVILDEPTAFLDVTARVEIMQLLRDLASDTGRTVIFSTHDLDLALRSADRMLVIGRDRSISVGAPEDLVLGGALEAAFSDGRVAFDSTNAAFTIRKQSRGAMRVVGSGEVCEWTRRALERVGFDTQDSEAERLNEVRVRPAGRYYRWSLSRGTGTGEEFDSLYDLVAAVRD